MKRLRVQVNIERSDDKSEKALPRRVVLTNETDVLE
jgi:hypothetical protein